MGIVRSCLVAVLLAVTPVFVAMAAQNGEASWYRAHVGITAAGLRLHLDQRPAQLERILRVTGLLEFLTTRPASLSSDESDIG